MTEDRAAKEGPITANPSMLLLFPRRQESQAFARGAITEAGSLVMAGGALTIVDMYLKQSGGV